MRRVVERETAEKNIETFNESTQCLKVLGFMGVSIRKQGASDAGRPALAGHAESVRQMREARSGRLLSRQRLCQVMSRALSSVTTSLVLALLVVPADQGLAMQLPPHIQADLYLMQAEEKIEKQDFAAAKAALDRILDLQKEHGLAIPEAFYFRYAEVSERVGLYKEAVESVTRYLTMAGRDGEHYKAALELLNATKAEMFSAERTCADKPKGSECWMELTSHPACYVWNGYLNPGKTVTWTGECAGGLAQGTGTLKWVWQSDPKSRDGSLSPSRAEPKCAGQPKGAACWMELANQPGCYVWNDYLAADETATWPGECSGGLAQGTGTLTWVWGRSKKHKREDTGRLQDGKQQGQWIFLRNADGSTSTRERFYVDGKYVGSTAEAEEMEGRIVGGKLHGGWVMCFANGRADEGPYVKGKRHGEWSIQFADDDGKLSGTVEEGPYVDGEKRGQWVFRHLDGDIEERPYKSGKLHGQVTGRAVDGKTWEVSFVNGKRDGLFINRFADGSVNNEGPYVEGKKHGRWTESFGDDGWADEGPYVDGKRHGQWVFRNEDGKAVIEKSYVEGELHGRWTERNGKGNVTKRGQHEHGKKHGEWIIDYGGDGDVDGKGPYVKGEKHGRWTEIDHEDPYEVGVDPGRAVLEGEYENDERVGQWTVRYRNGLIGNGPYGKPEEPENYSDLSWQEHRHYLSWHKHGQWTLTYRNGAKHEGPYVYGKKHGQWIERERDGDVSEGPYVDGEKTGLWEWRNTVGRVDKGRFKNGKRIGHWVFRLPGEQFWEGPYVDGKRHGQWVRRKKEGGGIKSRVEYRYGRQVE